MTKPKYYGGMFGTYERLNVHVNASNFAVIRAAREKLGKGNTREQRHRFYRTMLKHHADASALFRKWRF